MDKKRPGSELYRRPIHLIFILDTSSSMQGAKIEALNDAIKRVVMPLRDLQEENERARILVRAVEFADTARWHIKDPTPVQDFEWEDMKAYGETRMGEALSLVADAMIAMQGGPSQFCPVLLLVTDGHPTDAFEDGMARLMATKLGRIAIRIGIAIGKDADQEVLRRFISNPKIEPLTANDSDALTNYIKFVTVATIASHTVGIGAVEINKKSVDEAFDSSTDDIEDTWRG